MYMYMYINPAGRPGLRRRRHAGVSIYTYMYIYNTHNRSCVYNMYVCICMYVCMYIYIYNTMLHYYIYIYICIYVFVMCYVLKQYVMSLFVLFAFSCSYLQTYARASCFERGCQFILMIKTTIHNNIYIYV